MPARILTQSERATLGQFPREITTETIITHFTLLVADFEQLEKLRRGHNRLGFALQLLSLRFLGFYPEDLTYIPSDVIQHVARQIGESPDCLVQYGSRQQTRTAHQQVIELYLGFRSCTAEDLEQLSQWLVERALEHDKSTVLLQLAMDKLRADKIVRIGVTQLEKLVMSVRQQAYQITYQHLSPHLSDSCKSALDKLLLPDEGFSKTPLVWLRQPATRNSPAAILNAIEKLGYMQKVDVLSWEMSKLHPNRLKFLAQYAKRASTQRLQRMPEERRYPILMSFVYQLYEEVTDETIDLFIRCLADAYARARRDLENFRANMAKAINEKIHLFRDISTIILNPDVVNADVRPCIHEQITPEELQLALEESEKLLRPLDDSYFDFFSSRYSYFRQFVPSFFKTFEFQAHVEDKGVIQAIALLKSLDETRKRIVPNSAPLTFVTPKWRTYVTDASGQINRRYYELCLLWQLRSDLRSGNIWLKHSRRYANPETYLMPATEWAQQRTEICQMLQVSTAGEKRFQQLQADLTEQLQQLNQTIQSHEQVRIENDKLVISPLEGLDLSESSEKLQQQITQRLPWVDLDQLLPEVDQWSGFSDALVAGDENLKSTPEDKTYLYAALLAQACNFSLNDMAKAADLSYKGLLWYTNWYLQEDNLVEAINTLVNYHYHQPLAQCWGGGTLSSSDGQRFPVAVKNQQAVSLPRYFGYGQGVTFYSWSSDQHSQYRDKVIPSTVRDATYLLDGILDNETELAILEHTTDTAGYTDVIFALFDLLGLKFSPRLRDLASQRLYCVDSPLKYPNLKPILRYTLRPHLFLERWDEMLHVVASLKLGWVSASLFMAKLKSFAQKNALLIAFQEYGRLVKTIFILRYLNQPDYQRRITKQLNKGEHLHDLRRFLFFGNRGQIRQRQQTQVANQAHCLTLVTNAVVVWNTAYMQAILEQLEIEEYPIQAEDLNHLSPTRYAHINLHGRYFFELDSNLHSGKLRPLHSR